MTFIIRKAWYYKLDAKCQFRTFYRSWPCINRSVKACIIVQMTADVITRIVAYKHQSTWVLFIRILISNFERLWFCCYDKTAWPISLLYFWSLSSHKSFEITGQKLNPSWVNHCFRTNPCRAFRPNSLFFNPSKHFRSYMTHFWYSGPQGIK